MIRCAAVLFVAIGLAIAEPWNLAVDANLTLAQNAYGDNGEEGQPGCSPGPSTRTRLPKGSSAPR